MRPIFSFATGICYQKLYREVLVQEVSATPTTKLNRAGLERQLERLTMHFRHPWLVICRGDQQKLSYHFD